MKLVNIRCICGKLLFKVGDGEIEIEIVCPRCGNKQNWRVTDGKQ